MRPHLETLALVLRNKGGLLKEAVGTLSGGVVVDNRRRGGALVALRPALSSARLQGLRSLWAWEDHLWRLLT